MMTKEEYTNIVNFMTPRVGVDVVVCVNNFDLEKMLNSI